MVVASAPLLDCQHMTDYRTLSTFHGVEMRDGPKQL